MDGLTSNNWPSARHFTEALQCPALCFSSPFLRDTLPAVDKLGMPLVTSGQFAYVYKLNRPDGGSWGVRCFRAYLPDRQERYAALDTHFRAHPLAALPRFAYEPEGLLIGGQRYPMLVMEWLAAPTLDNYLEKVLDRPDILTHLAAMWARLTTHLRAIGVAHGDLQQGNILVQNGAFRLVDLDGMYVPALHGRRACEVGHQHFQHPQRDESWFHADLDNFSALAIYLSLLALAQRPTLWREHHDENLLFTRADFQNPDKSALFARIRELGEETQRLADILAEACRRPQPNVPPLAQLVEVAEESQLPAWMTAPLGVEVVTRTREAVRAPLPPPPTAQRPGPPPPNYAAGVMVRPNLSNPYVTTPNSSVQTLFNGPAHTSAAQPGALANVNPADLWSNTFTFAGQATKAVFTKIGAFWVIFLFSSVWLRLITGFWQLFGVGPGPGFVLTLLLITLCFLLYGFVRALDAWGHAVPPGAQVTATQGSHNPAQPYAVNSAPAMPALPPGVPSNIPWYRQNAAPPQATPLPLTPGARRAPDWAIRAQSPPAPPANNSAPMAFPFRPPPALSVPAAGVVGHRARSLYHAPDCHEVGKIPASDFLTFATPAEAGQAGYQSCVVCNPHVWARQPSIPAALRAAAANMPPVVPNAASPAPVASSPPVIGNRDTGVYHWPDCEAAVIIPKEDALPFVSPRAAELQGLRRCVICKPSSRQVPLTTPPLPVVANQATGVYHYPDCPWAVKMTVAQARHYLSAEEAERKGFHRCSDCHSPKPTPFALPRPPATTALFLIGNTQDKVCHRRDCSVIQNLPPATTLRFDSLAAAQAGGYQRCLKCQP